MSTPLWAQSATTLAKMIRSKEVSSREVVSAHLDRIEAVNGQVRAITAVLADSALAAADAADRTEPHGPFHGVPFSIKENIDCMGSATTQGLPAMRDAIPTVDGPTVERMKAAGAIPLARTNLPEMGLRIDTENPLHGRTFNPWNPAVAVGGSSGGEGAALATGMSPLGLGNDIGGSLRNPAFCCGITSIKATPGRIPWALSLVPAEQTVAYGLMISEGPMARTVADVKAAYEVLVGWHSRDPFSVDAGRGAFPPVPKRVALVTEVPGVALPKAFIEAVERAGAVLAEAGWELVSAVPPELPRVHEVWAYLLLGDVLPNFPMLEAVMSPPAVAMLGKLAERFPAEAMGSDVVHRERYRLMQRWSIFFQETPLVIGPGWTDFPFPIGADLDPDHGIDTTLDRLRFVTPGNLLGLPAMPVPLGVSNGLPVAVQIYAGRWREDLCFEAASQLEAAVGTLTPIDPRA